MSKIIIYHGSNIEIQEPQIIQRSLTKDFGTGFYCTVIREQAERWAKRYDSPMVNTYSAILNEKLSILEFQQMTEEWLDFIVDCRSGKSHSYDIVIGAMANDQVYNYISDYIEGALTREQFWVMAKFKYPTHQMAFCSKSALECLQYVSCEEVSL